MGFSGVAAGMIASASLCASASAAAASSAAFASAIRFASAISASCKPSEISAADSNCERPAEEPQKGTSAPGALMPSVTAPGHSGSGATRHSKPPRSPFAAAANNATSVSRDSRNAVSTVSLASSSAARIRVPAEAQSSAFTRWSFGISKSGSSHFILRFRMGS